MASLSQSAWTGLFDPFKSATVFLCHSSADNDISDAMFSRLSVAFRVLYDRGTLYDIGDPILKRQAIVSSDLFLFLASPDSMRPDSWAFAELQVADGSRLARTSRIALVAIDDYDPQDTYSNRIYERCKRPSVDLDIDRIVAVAKRKLVLLGGLVETPDGFVAGRDPQIIIEALALPSANKKIYELAAVFTATGMARLIREIAKLPSVERDRICNTLLDLYLWDTHQTTRQNAVYILSRIRAGDQTLASDVKRKYPEHVDQFLYRGFHVSLGFLGDIDSLNNYVDLLITSRDREWEKQRAINERFHVLYYGGREGAIANLRDEIRTCDPPNLLALDIATLGMLSSSPRDVDLLTSQQGKLLSFGVEPKIIRRAIGSMRLRSRPPRAGPPSQQRE